MRSLRACGRGEIGDAVADLHEALRSFHADGRITADERSAKLFGPGTTVAVREFCEARGIALPAGPGLDQATADAINRQLVHDGILYVAYGPIVGVGGGVPENSLVFGFDVDFVGGAQLGETSTTGDQTYRLMYDPFFYRSPGPGHDKPKDALALVISIYANDGRELARSEVKEAPGREEEMPLRSSNVTPADGGRVDDDWILHGVVEDRDGPAAGVRVVASDRDVGPYTQELGSGTTNDAGEFRIVYHQADFQTAEGSTSDGAGPDIIFELSTDPGGPSLAFDLYPLQGGRRSPQPSTDNDLVLGMQASRNQEVALRLHDPLPRREVEYRWLMRTLAPLLRARSPSIMDETKRRDITFAARETGVDSGLIATLAAAHQLAEAVFDMGVQPDLLYGLARSEWQLGTAAQLALAGRKDLTAAIKQAVDRFIIDPHTDDDIEKAILHILDTGPDIVRTGLGGGQPLGPVLDTVLKDADDQRVFLRAATGRQSDPAKMWDELRKHPAFEAPGKVERTQLALQLDALTGRHLSLMSALMDTGITSPIDLLDGSALADVVARVGAPEGTPGEGDEERAQNYASVLSREIHEAFPTLSVARTLSTMGPAVGGEEVRTALTSLLTRLGDPRSDHAGHRFDIGATHIDAFLEEHGDAVLAEIDEPLRTPVVNELKRTQRLYRISTSPKAIGWLLTQPHRSAYDIANITQSDFVNDATVAVGPAEAAMIHSRARAVADAVVATHLQLVHARTSRHMTNRAANGSI